MATDPMLIIGGVVLTVVTTVGAAIAIPAWANQTADAVNTAYSVCYDPQTNNLETLSSSAEAATAGGAGVDAKTAECQALYGVLEPALDAYLAGVARLEDFDLETATPELRAEVAKWQAVLTPGVLEQMQRTESTDEALAYWRSIVATAEKGGEL
ncbi:hypothetical protein [Microbacterium sp. Leaf203]|uniref:hypothetical protein n=1 Tax=Microbacterium sp. Leaf203 TaxID=1735677 RepID=UPI0006F62A79|nr:hypothetical protein [Microbacterium sp. Leaf203]KQM36858.1 hypothetical protein ASE56_10615 [Microbacterium sp. Leaf203]